MVKIEGSSLESKVNENIQSRVYVNVEDRQRINNPQIIN